MKILHLNLKRKWFDMIRSGEKKEEYRDITPYWIVRIMNFKEEMWEADINDFSLELNNPFSRHDGPRDCMEYYGANFLKFDLVHFKNGFARGGKPAPAFNAKFSGIRVAAGKPEWGAAPGKLYSVIDITNVAGY